MKHFFLLSILFVSGFAFAQEESKFRLGVSYAPQMILKKQGSVSVKGLYSFSSGISGTMQLGEKFSIGTGVSYSQRNYRIVSTFPTDVNPQTGTYDTVFDLQYSSRFIEIPVRLTYNFATFGKVRLLASVGVHQQFSVNQRTEWIAQPYNEPEVREFRVTSESEHLSSTGASLSLGVDVSIGQRMHLLLEPTMYNYFSNETIAFNSETGWLAGLNVGLQWGL